MPWIMAQTMCALFVCVLPALCLCSRLSDCCLVHLQAASLWQTTVAAMQTIDMNLWVACRLFSLIAYFMIHFEFDVRFLTLCCVGMQLL